jgi:hypothetical protein
MILRSCYNYTITAVPVTTGERDLWVFIATRLSISSSFARFAWRQVKKVHMSQTERRPGYSRVLTWLAMHDFSDDIKLRTNAIRRQLYYNIIMPLSQPCQSSRYGKFFAGPITVQVMHGLLPLFSG